MQPKPVKSGNKPCSPRVLLATMGTYGDIHQTRELARLIESQGVQTLHLGPGEFADDDVRSAFRTMIPRGITGDCLRQALDEETIHERTGIFIRKIHRHMVDAARIIYETALEGFDLILVHNFLFSVVPGLARRLSELAPVATFHLTPPNIDPATKDAAADSMTIPHFVALPLDLIFPDAYGTRPANWFLSLPWLNPATYGMKESNKQSWPTPYAVVSLGSFSPFLKQESLEALLEAVEDIDLKFLFEGIWTMPNRVPTNVEFVGQVPHRDLFPKARLVMTHASAGATSLAMHLNRPIVPLPQFADQELWSRACVSLGFARGYLRPEQWSVEAISELVKATASGPSAIPFSIPSEYPGASAVSQEIKRLVSGSRDRF